MTPQMTLVVVSVIVLWTVLVLGVLIGMSVHRERTRRARRRVERERADVERSRALMEDQRRLLGS